MSHVGLCETAVPGNWHSAPTGEGDIVTRKSVTELLDSDEPAWPVIQEMFAAADNRVEVLPRDEQQAEQTLEHLQVTIGSPLGAIAYETGGVLVDDGWLRLLGSGAQRMSGSLRSWNDGTVDTFGLFGKAVLVAHDVVGGFFALNGGAFGGPRGHVHYLSPDTMEWEDLELPYSDFLTWAATGDLQTYYADSRWPGWREQVAPLSGGQGVLIYPPLWAVEGGELASRTKKAVPIAELWALAHEWRSQLGLSAD